MREVKLTQKEHIRFIQAMEKRLSEEGMNLMDLASEIGVSVRSIYNFRNDSSRNPSKFLAGKIATRLGLLPRDWRF